MEEAFPLNINLSPLPLDGYSSDEIETLSDAEVAHLPLHADNHLIPPLSHSRKNAAVPSLEELLILATSIVKETPPTHRNRLSRKRKNKEVSSNTFPAGQQALTTIYRQTKQGKVSLNAVEGNEEDANTNNRNNIKETEDLHSRTIERAAASPSSVPPPPVNRHSTTSPAHPVSPQTSPLPTTSSGHSVSLMNQKSNTFAEMFPLLSASCILAVRLQCEGELSKTIDLLLVVNSERNQQSPTTNYRGLCTLWVKGKCTEGRAAACRDRHFYTDKDIVSEVRDEGRKSSLEAFSSPYKARVLKEYVRVIKEQFNLDSGLEEKWWELQVRELVDLTGDEKDEVSESTRDEVEDKNNNIESKGSKNKT